MQFVDFWVGVPLCLFFAVFNRLSIFLFSRPAQAPRKILFVELSEMGSAILAYSSLVQAKRKFSNSEVYFLIFEKNRESCDILNILPRENVLTIDERSFLRLSFSTFRILLKIRRLKIDTVIDLELFSRFTALITFLSGARNRVGFHRLTEEGLYRGNFLTHRVRYNAHQHMAYNFLALVCALEASPDELPLLKRDVRPLLIETPLFESKKHMREHIVTLIRSNNARVTEENPLIVVNPDPGDALPIRGWPMDRYLEACACMLDAYPQAFLVVVGLKASKPYAEAICQALGSERVVDLTGQTKSLEELVTVLTLSTVLVTNDSGPAHLAALSRTATVALFGPETPDLYGPLGNQALSLFANYACSPCVSAANHRRTICNDNKCLQAISVEEVLAAVNDIAGEKLGAIGQNRKSPALRVLGR